MVTCRKQIRTADFRPEVTMSDGRVELLHKCNRPRSHWAGCGWSSATTRHHNLWYGRQRTRTTDERRRKMTATYTIIDEHGSRDITFEEHEAHLRKAAGPAPREALDKCEDALELLHDAYESTSMIGPHEDIARAWSTLAGYLETNGRPDARRKFL